VTGVMTYSPPLPAPHPRARHRGLFWLAAVVAVFALVGGTVMAVTSYLSSARPADVVTSYFTALAHDDAARALSYGPVPAGDTSFLTADVLKDQLAVGAISDFQVLTVNKSSADAAKVNVSYQLSGPGESHVVTDTVPVIRKDRHWWLAASAVSTRVGLARAGQRAMFAGTSFPAGSVLLFPGALPITFDTGNLELGASHANVQFATADNTNLAVEASATGIGAARAAVGTALTSCLAESSANVFCPVPGNGSSTVRAVPNTLRGTLATGATDGLAVSVSPSAAGVLLVDGTVLVNGHYVSLAYANTTAPVTDAKISVSVAAQCYATTPTTITWRTP
jgi:hypothetical protein